MESLVLGRNALLLLRNLQSSEPLATPGSQLTLLCLDDAWLLEAADGTRFEGIWAGALAQLAAASREGVVSSISYDTAPCTRAPLARVALRLPSSPLRRGLAVKYKPAALSLLWHAAAGPGLSPPSDAPPVCGFAGCDAHAPGPPAASLRVLFDELPSVRARVDGREAVAMHAASPCSVRLVPS